MGWLFLFHVFFADFADGDHRVRHSYIDDSGMAPACLSKHTCGG